MKSLKRRTRLRPWVVPAAATMMLLGIFAAYRQPTEEIVPATPTETLKPQPSPVKAEPTIDWQEGSFSSKPFFKQMREAGLDANQAQNLIDALSPFFDFRRARPTHHWRLALVEGKPASFELQTSPATIFDVQNLTGDPVASKRPIETVVEKTVVRGRIDSSLYGSLRDAQDSAELAQKLSNVFAYQIDFYQDPREGDSFEMLVEQELVRTENGLVFHKWGNVLAARYEGSRETHSAYWFEGMEEPGYFDQDGQSLVRDVLRSPLKLQRVTSAFKAKRFHPILKTVRPHNGVDYGVPKGTPVMAVASGSVARAGRMGGAGIAVELKHRKEMLTQYFHLDKIADGVRPGSKVKQGQVIGYVGKTGLATSYHLHFGMKIGGKYVNPLDQKFQPGQSITKAQKAAFEEAVKAYHELIEGAPEHKAEPMTHMPGLLDYYKPERNAMTM